MKILFAILMFCSTASAQNVTQIKGADVTVTVPKGQLMSVGDPISFIDGTLNTVARGTVQKVSEGGSIAIVRIKDGSVKVGQQAEFLKTQASSGPLTLSPEDQSILERGEISTTRYVLGGLLAIYPGLGIGHAVQYRFKDRGWIFLVGELGGSVLMVMGLAQCLGTSLNRSSCDGSQLVLGYGLLLGFKIWEIVDAWAVPPSLNDRYRYLKGQKVGLSGGLLPTPDGALLTMKLDF